MECDLADPGPNLPLPYGKRFNETLKRMLQKFVSETGKDWPQWVPFLLFAIREVPQASTGFSPFKLLYLWQPRGHVRCAQGIVSNPGPGGGSPVSYLEALRKKMRASAQLAQNSCKGCKGNKSEDDT